MGYNVFMAESRKRQERESTHLDPLTAALLENLPGMAYRCQFDGERTMRFVSRGCLDLTGYSAEELLSGEAVSFDYLIVAADRKAFRREIESSIAEKRPYRKTYRLTTADGEERWVLDKGACSGEAQTAPDETAVILLGFVTDYSERMADINLLEKRVADRTRRLSALYDILEAASAPTDLQTTIERSLSRVLTAVEGAAGAVHLLDKSGATLQLAAEINLPLAVSRNLAQIDVQESLRAGWIVRSNRPLFIPQMVADPRAADLAVDSGLDVYIAVPIVANELVRGVLTILSKAPSTLSSEEEMELLISVGEQLGVVVDNARLRQQMEQLIVLEERNRLARELHDSVTQSLYSVTLFAEAGINLARSGEHTRAAPLFNDILDTGRQALKEMRLLVHRLRPSVLEKEGLVQAMQHRLNAVEGRAGVKHQVIVDGPLHLSAELEDVFFFVAQEALNNALKHASAGEVRIDLQQDARGTRLAITDNGRGFDPQVAAKGSGFGLITMRERIEQMGGEISYESAPGHGTKIEAVVPAGNLRAMNE